ESTNGAIKSHIGLVGEIVHVLPAVVAIVDVGGGIGRRGRAVVRGTKARARGDVAVAGRAVARQAVDAGVGREAVLDACRERVDVRANKIAFLRIHRHVLGRLAVGHGARQVATQVGLLVLAAQAVVVDGDRQV